jgi:hypothetical protein
MKSALSRLKKEAKVYSDLKKIGGTKASIDKFIQKHRRMIWEGKI